MQIKLRRYKAKCSYCNEVIPGRLELLPTDIKDCVSITTQQRRVYLKKTDLTGEFTEEDDDFGSELSLVTR